MAPIAPKPNPIALKLQTYKEIHTSLKALPKLAERLPVNSPALTLENQLHHDFVDHLQVIHSQGQIVEIRWSLGTSYQSKPPVCQKYCWNIEWHLKIRGYRALELVKDTAWQASVELSRMLPQVKERAQGQEAKALRAETKMLMELFWKLSGAAGMELKAHGAGVVAKKKKKKK